MINKNTDVKKKNHIKAVEEKSNTQVLVKLSQTPDTHYV